MEGRVLKAPSLSLLARAGVGRALLEPLFARPLRDDLPLRAFLEQRLGRRAGGLAAQVMSAGVYAGDPDSLSARDAFPTLGALAEKGSLILQGLRKKEGTSPRNLDAAPRSRKPRRGPPPARWATGLRLGAPVARLAPSRGGWEVEGEKFDAIRAGDFGPGRAEVARAFAPGFADALRELRSAPVTIVHLGLAPDGLPRGFGMIDADGTLHGIGTLLPGSMLPGRAPAGRTLVTLQSAGARGIRSGRRCRTGSWCRVDVRFCAPSGVCGRRPDYVRVVRWRDAFHSMQSGTASGWPGSGSCSPDSRPSNWPEPSTTE